jgi:hypothetical protein
MTETASHRNPDSPREMASAPKTLLHHPLSALRVLVLDRVPYNDAHHVGLKASLADREVIGVILLQRVDAGRQHTAHARPVDAVADQGLDQFAALRSGEVGGPTGHSPSCSKSASCAHDGNRLTQKS